MRNYTPEEFANAGFEAPHTDRDESQRLQLALVRPKDEPADNDKSESHDDNPYLIQDGCLYRTVGDQTKYLANFIAWPVLETVIDDGCAKGRQYDIEGKLSTGEALPRITVLQDKFTSMGWIPQWGMQVRIQPGQLNKEYVRDYIQSQAATLVRRALYTHTGFREIDGQLVYLYNGGAIGADGVECELDEDLRGYSFQHSAGVEEADAFRAMMDFFGIAPPTVSVPLLGSLALAPLIHFFEQVGLAPSFALYLYGETGSFKTTLASLGTACFRNYKRSDPATTNFHSTSNAIERMAFTLKDAPLLVDDYHPTSPKEKAHMDDVAQRLARGAGDHLSRKRMNADTTLKASYPPRCVAIITGEDIPNIGESGTARFFMVKSNKGSIKSDDLTRCQGQAVMLNAFMRNFITWLIINRDVIPTELEHCFRALRDEVKITGQHARLPENIAWLQTAIVMVTEYADEMSFMTDDEVESFRTNSWETLLSLGADQCAITREEKPVAMFLSAIHEMTSTGAKVLHSVSNLSNCDRPKDLIGFEDTEVIYVEKGVTYAAVRQYYEGMGQAFPVGWNRLVDDLQKAGLIIPGDKGPTQVKRINGKPHRVLAVRKSAFQQLEVT